MYTFNVWLTIYYLASLIPVHSSPAQPITRPQPPLSPDGLANYSLANAGLGYGPVPRGFTVRFDIQLPHITPEPALLSNIAHFIKELGQSDFNGEIQPQDFRAARYPAPAISIDVPPGKTGIKREYVIYALFIMSYDLYDRNPPGGMLASHYTLLLNDQEIGGLSFGIKPAGAIAKRTTTSQEEPPTKVAARIDPENMVARQENNQTVGTAADLTNNRLRVDWTYFGTALNKKDLIMGLLWTMAVASMPDSQSRINTNFVPQWMEGHTRFIATASPRPRPPYLTYFWMLEALADTVDYLYQQNRFGNIKMVMVLDGAQIGQGLFHHM
ncbi:MAG: hypothetical protein Q9168_007890 [Polycauliona sp. 1 TL-2023]